MGDVNDKGFRIITFELNGKPRETAIQDKSVKAAEQPRDTADPADPAQVGAPIPGMVTSISVSVGQKVSKGDKLLALEAMKMQTTVYALCDGVVGELLVGVGDSVDSKDLLVRLRTKTG